MTSILVGDILRNSASRYPDRVAVIAGDERLTYSELQTRTEAIRRGLYSAGISSGSRVACLARTSVAYLALYFATADLGAILVPLNYWQRGEEVSYVLNDVEPSLLFYDEEFEELANGVANRCDNSPRLLCMPAWGQTGSGNSEWLGFLAKGQDAKPECSPEPTDAHLILYTSGTTGRPKGAMLTQEGTVASAFSVALAYRLERDDSFVSALTPFHIASWGHINPFLLLGATVTLLPSFDAKQAYGSIVAERSTIIILAPVMIHQIMNLPEFDRGALEAVRLVVFGAFDPSGIMRRFGELLGATPDGPVQMLHAYGITEGGIITVHCRPQDVFSHWGAIGKASEGYQVRLVSPEGGDVESGEPGEIWIKGPIMKAYWRRDEATASTLVDGWLRTGDVGVRDDEGFITVVDRLKDMIRSGAQNIYCKQIEDCLITHPDVTEVAVIGVPDPEYEEAVCAVVVPKEVPTDSQLLATSIQDYVRERIAGYNVPKHVRFVDALPKNSLGKILKRNLRDVASSV
ncbi:class I adenylate-forming enzyme family protein [Auritidibacter ignavus]|uniref:class I adenylate-forming enzyme family protein n=1 Tax=Auritidibacter ignavus TaxID=678932 RepID=UPI00244A7B5B|nr:class I adenylate-forming enzyme family protein [Auritidibacter ignavus]WGH81084.1 class I adenylate-forming enzyme family protein [Auritidibacter ignavus]WHS35894.1 class I adenylate-forming enzyme family protein [Auritidibacter ignavus]